MSDDHHSVVIPAPGPEFRFEAGDTVVAVGTAEHLAALRTLIGP